MRKLTLFVLVLLSSVFCYAQDDLYKFDDMFSISVSKNLELRTDSDVYTIYLRDSMGVVDTSAIVFQQRGLSKREKVAQSHYCRIMIRTVKDNSCPFPCSNDSSDLRDAFDDFISLANAELAPGQEFIFEPQAAINVTKSEAYYVLVYYSRTGAQGPVSVCMCYLFNYDCFAKVVMSYRESEASMWRDDLKRAINSFTWLNPYHAQVYSSNDDSTVQPITQDVHNDSFNFFGLFCLIIIALIIWGLIRHSQKKKEAEYQQKVDIQISQVRSAIQQKKLVSASKLFQETKKFDLSKYPLLEDKVCHVQVELKSLSSSVSKEVDSQIEVMKKEFPEDPSLITSKKVTKILANKEIPSSQRSRVQQEIKQLEDEYQKGVIPEQHHVIVNYDIAQCVKTGNYAFYTAPVKSTEVYPYRRRKMELRGYSEEAFEAKLRNSLRTPNYKVMGDVCILTAEGAHPFEPDIAIVETRDNCGLRIDIEIDEPYSGFEKTPIHYVGCGDEFRDRNLANLGWLVVRFSEKQIVQEPDNCIFFIHRLLSQVDSEFTCAYPGVMPTPDKCWSEVEARIMAIQKYREKLLNHEFDQMQKSNVVTTSALSDLEKEVAQKAKPVYVKPSISPNIDRSDLSFKQDSKLAFEPGEHIYLFDGKTQLTAVSNVISQFFPAFDAFGLSYKVALRDGLSQEYVLEQWDCNGQEARDIGTFLHAQIEAFLTNRPVSDHTHFSYSGQYFNVDKNVSIKEELTYFKSFLSENPITPFRTEWHICDTDLKIAGTIDLLCRNGNSFDIYDWKRSRKASPSERVWHNGINGLQHIPDISFYHYAIQQNLYKYILEKNYGIIVGNMYIVVLHPDLGQYQKFQIPDMSKEINIICNYLVAKNL